MSYQVLARKWRPQNFSELVGQEHVQRALINALDNDRLHHAFLFTGTRGVGKTTIARILAKSLNCETGISSTPCGKCNTCQEISEGRYVDLIEVDAASRTKVEDTRELLENVQYAPTRGRYKVYLIDEVHMLSTHSFNALLKTLEEPPEHVKFLLATTDPQKLPVTILSRCLQFNLKRLPIPQIHEHLIRILEAEHIPYDNDGVMLVARAADGSLRDALSLLDQAIAYGGGSVHDAEVRAMLGAIEHKHIIELLALLANGDSAGIINKIQALSEQSLDFFGILNELITALHYVALAQVAPQSLDESLIDVASIKDLAARIGPEDVQLFYQIALLGRRDLPLVPEPRLGFEMTLLRMLAFQPQTAGKTSTPPVARAQPAHTANAVTEPTSPSEAAFASAAKTTATTPQTAQTPAAMPPAAAPNPAATPKATTAAVRHGSEQDLRWEQLATELKLSGLSQQLALHCGVKSQSEQELKLLLAETHQHLLNPTRLASLEQAVAKALGDGVKVSVEVVTDEIVTPAALKQQRAAEKQQHAVDEIYNDQTVKSIINAFDAKVNPESITPVE
ncbi:DNA polymerase III subunit gamma/tau [Kaarinaea lacus]